MLRLKDKVQSAKAKVQSSKFKGQSSKEKVWKIKDKRKKIKVINANRLRSCVLSLQKMLIKDYSKKMK